ncbi:MAG: hypothetical protein ABIF92_01175 [archaeon]
MPKKKEEQLDILKEQDKIKELVQKYQQEEAQNTAKAQQQMTEEFSIESREFKDFYQSKLQSEKPKGFFERIARVAGKIIKIKVKDADAERMGKMLYSLGYHITPADVMGLGILVMIIFSIAAAGLILVNYVFSLALILGGLILMLLIQNAPKYLYKSATVETMNYMPLTITYMVIYMRSAPTLEGAVEFAAKHLSGPLARDLRTLLWGLHNGLYLSMEQALKDYADQWKDEHKAFYEALNILRDSEKIANEIERIKMLDEAGRVILQGNFDMMKSFARGLDMPIMILYMLCIVLPVMGLVIAPIITTVMAQDFNSNWLIVIYDVILPIIVYGLTKSILKTRPGSFNQPDIENVEGVPKPGCMLIPMGKKKVNLRLMPISILAFLIVSMPGILMFVQGTAGAGFSMSTLIRSMTFIWGAAIGIAIYGLGTSFQKLKVRKELIDLESSLNTALYQLGNTLKMGTPVERAMDSAAAAVKKGAVHDLFTIASENIQKYKMTLEQAFFNPDNGAMRRYPSKLASTILHVLIESSKVGMQATSSAMITIGSYLENLNRIKESIKNLIGQTLGSMKFQARFLTSFITGVIVALDVLLFKILVELGSSMSDIGTADLSGVGGMGATGIFQNSLFSVASVIPAHHMQMMVGAYMVITTVLLSILINGTENGTDNVSRNNYIGKNILIATVVYSVASLVGVLIFTSFSI